MKYLFLTGLAIGFIACRPSSQPEYPTATTEPLYDLSFTDVERDSMQDGLEQAREAYRELHQYKIENSVAPAFYFDPLPTGFQLNTNQEKIEWPLPSGVSLPDTLEELAFYPVYKLAVLIQSRKLTSTQLMQIYLDRIKRYSDTLECLVLLTEELALQQARRADEEIAAGKYRGPLHGIPYGIKDLLEVEGTKTTWGAEPFRNRESSTTATVVRKLNEAGAVMLGKFSLGALAMGDIWFGGKTRNPWNPEQGSSGSSAGSASATSAGLVAFAIGTETRGSFVSPSTRCGATGLRPTFGAVSRHGAMALSWSMDKIGPICRSALDCGIVFDAIRGADPLDKSTRQAAFNFPAKADLKKLKVGYVKSYFESDSAVLERHKRTLNAIRALGVELLEVELPADMPFDAMNLMLTAEAAAAFDELTRSNRDDLLVNQLAWAWPNTFRQARFIPAVEYINASRARAMLIEKYHEFTKDYDVIVVPSFSPQLSMTNLTGHPCLVLPDGFNEKGSPTSITLLGKLYGEAALIQLGHAFQQATGWEDKHPPLFSSEK